MCSQILALVEIKDDAQRIADTLAQSGHKVVLSGSFANAIAVLDRKNIDLIISDVHLENGGSVFDFLKSVKANSLTRNIPFVLFSFHPSKRAKYLEDGVRTTARMLGATKYITMNSFDSAEFRKQIDRLTPKTDGVAAKELESRKL